MYRGTLLEVEDNMNCQLSHITYTARDGRVSELEHVFVRGSKVRFLILPDMLKNAPMFKKVETKSKGRGLSVTRARGILRKDKREIPFLKKQNQ